MNDTFENKSIDIDGTEFLTIIEKRLESKNYFPQLEAELQDIFKTKKMHPENIKELSTWSAVTMDNYEHHYKMLRDAINDGVCPTCATEMVEQNIYDSDVIFNYLFEYFDFYLDDNQNTVVNWRDDNE